MSRNSRKSRATDLACIVLLSLVMAMPLHAQQGTIAGTVVSGRSEEAISGAQVMIEGTTRGTVTDASGRFRLLNVVGTEVGLRVQMIGFRRHAQRVQVGATDVRVQLQQILLNLLGDAVKFTHARAGAPGRIEVSRTVEDGAAGGRVSLHVRDTGGGIAAEQLERVFEPFVQVDQRLTRPHEGVGLGLAISRDLARGMGGDLTAESTPGVGSTFTLTLPAA